MKGLSKASLVDGQPNSPSRINIKQGRVKRNIAEGSYKGNDYFPSTDPCLDLPSDIIMQFQEFFGRDVCDQVSIRPIEADDFSMNPILSNRRVLLGNDHQLFCFRSDLSPVFPSGQASGNRREDVASVKSRGACAAEHPGGVADFTSAFQSVAINHRRDDAVVGHHKVLISFRLDYQWLT